MRRSVSDRRGCRTRPRARLRYRSRSRSASSAAALGFDGVLQRREPFGPELLQERRHRLEPLCPHHIELADALAPCLDQAGVLQDTQVLAGPLLGGGEMLGTLVTR